VGDAVEGSLAPARAGRSWPYFRLGLGVLWLLVIGTAVLVGQRVTPLPELDSAIASGRVTSVQVLGGMEPGSSGSSLVEVHWRDGLIRRITEVTQISAANADTFDSGAGTGQPVISGDVGTRLSTGHPGLTVLRKPFEFEPGATVFDWRVPQWTGIVAFFAGLGTLALLINGPPPWWATRWAWFWLMVSPLSLVAALAFVALSGPAPWLRPPRDVTRRVGAGWVVLALIVFAAVPWVAPWPWL